MIGFLQRLGLAKAVCLNCGKCFYGKEQGYICEDCLTSLKPHHPLDYSRRIPYISSYRIFALYEGVLRQTLIALKFQPSKALAINLGTIIKDHLFEYLEEIKPDLITFPPLNIRRLWSRGFNHAEWILKGAGVPAVSLFKRHGFSPPMARLNREERQRAVKEYRLKKKCMDLLEDKIVLLFDDLLTTGATAQRLAELLLSVGAREVHAYFVAREQ